jgi:CheY-like chemotaxis protein
MPHRASEAAAPESPPSWRSLRVLIVDDEREVADALCLLVKSWGHNARQAYDGASGLLAAASLLPQVVLLDITMPGMDGYEVAGQLRLRPGLKGCFLVALRAHDDQRGGPLWKESDIDLFLAKPANSEVVESLLRMEAERLKSRRRKE